MEKIENSWGKKNNVVVVINSELWKGQVGDSIREVLATPLEGLFREEPLFDIIQLAPQIFNSKFQKFRNIIVFSENEKHQFQLEKNFYATPQNIFFIREDSPKKLINTFMRQSDSIVNTIQNLEFDQTYNELTKETLNNTENITRLFACTIDIPATYKLIKQSTERFVWYQKPLESGDVNLMIYEVPHKQIRKGNPEIFESDIIVAKDSVTKKHIKGNYPGSYLLTQNITPPVFFDATLQDFPIYGVIGNWRMHLDFMDGPFLSIIIDDNYYQRYLFIEGYVNAPFQKKRDILMEIETIIETINFYKK